MKYPNGAVIDRTVKLPLVIFNANFTKDKLANTSNSNNETDAKENLTNTSSSAGANEASKWITCPKNLTQDNIDFNSSIKNPFISRVKPSGQFTLQFNKNRIREGACRRLQEDFEGQAGETLIVDGLQRVIGQINDGQPLKGLSVYVEASEMTDANNLKFSYSVVKVA